ncbi:oxygen-independent coproporphyrinogen-3 oxidase [Alteribacillus persepolensis]|uniref:Heme chaperone HemW n=1 Tax=Alteribacillus persepolensis TaxID=568899 RepID=A0A1G8JC97_9BACI|nr:coproporphyrinogen-III oxidase family protein [Alteribacillus persepolensis]SDI28250.1 oxygen-independent coproporphyrinogen-3 oxidase [Alteribacillus persepolensis]
MNLNINNMPFDEIPALWNFFYPVTGNLETTKDHAPALVKDYLNEDTNTEGLTSLYLHIPFCDTICTFCPFIKTTKYAENLVPYVDALVKEIKKLSSTPRLKGRKIDSIYIGGGTPSVLKPDQIKRLGEAITSNFDLADDYEWTFECAALTTTEDRVKAMTEVGVNRGSFGVQTFNQKFKKMFNLQWSDEQVQHTRDLMMHYFNACNMDLLYHLPGQTSAEILEDLHKSIALNTSSIDVYPLEYLAAEKNFLSKINKNRYPTPPLPLEKINQNKLIYDTLNQSGYFQNYVYTFTKKDAKYKRFKFSETIYGNYEDEFFALGIGGHSTFKGLSYDNVGDVKTYIEMVNKDILPIGRAMKYHAYERGLIFFPKKMRIGKKQLAKYNLDTYYYQKLNELESKNMIYQTADEFILTDEGKVWFANIMVELMPPEQRKALEYAVGSMQEAKDWKEESKTTVIST